MRIDASGSVGIGTTSPGALLDVNGVIKLSGNTYAAGPSLSNQSDGILLVGGATSGVRINNSGNTVELLRVTNAGNVGIADTASLGGRLNIKWAGASQQGLVMMSTDATFGGSPIVFYNSAVGVSGYILQSTNSVAYNTASDRRLKENIRPTSRGLELLMKIAVPEFNFISDPRKTRVQGFIAQDLYKKAANDNMAVLRKEFDAYKAAHP